MLLEFSKTNNIFESMNIRFLTLAIILLLNTVGLYSQEDSDYYEENRLRYDNYTYNDSINAVKIFRLGWRMSYPVIGLNTDDKIKLIFDEVGRDVKDYYYKIIHCTKDWKPSDLMTMEYINGVENKQVTDYSFSFNTVVSYTHYEIVLPDDDMQITKSGNYLIMVYEDNDEEKLVLTRRFMVYEPLVDIKGMVDRASDLDYIKTHQEINFSIFTNQLYVNDPYSEIKPVILQNGFWNFGSYDISPTMVKDKEIVYNYNSACLFPGVDEFRHFDAKDLKYQTQNVKEIVFEPPYYHFKLYDDEVRRFMIYKSDEDIDGKYLIKANYRTNSDIEADYIHVYFTLPYDEPLSNGNVYVFGDLSDGQFTAKNRMIYNYRKKAYQLRLMLKQGYYNYWYVLYKDESKKPDATYFEGSHYQTENDYMIIVYYRSMSSTYDRIVGYNVINSVTK